MAKQHPEAPIVSVDVLAAHLGAPDWVVVDCRFDLMNPAAGRLAWEQGHVPGAYYADLDRDLAAPVRADGAGGRHPLPEPEAFERLLRSWGVSAGTRVVAYDDVGNAVAARLWWLLRWIGHERAAVLDGGLPAWEAAGFELSNETPSSATGSIEARPGSMPVLDAAAVAAALEAGTITLFDARAAERYAGRVEPLDKRAGHVPGAVNMPFQDNLGTDKCFPRGQRNAGILSRRGRR